MNNLFIILLILVFSQIGNIASSQSVYFNNRYYLNEPDIWSGALNAIEVDSGYIVTGTTGDSLNEYWLVVAIMKIDQLGNKQWIKLLRDSISEYDNGQPGSLIKTFDCNYAFSGTSRNYENSMIDRATLWKLDTNWNLIWNKEYGNIDNIADTMNYGRQVKQTVDSGYIIGGEQYYSSSRAISKMLIIRTDKYGNKEWESTFSYSGNVINRGYSVIQTTDSGFAIGGFKYTPGHPETGDPIVIKTDSIGNQQWLKNIGGPYLDNKAMLCLGKDGSIIAATTYADSMFGNDNAYRRIHIVKIDNLGNIVWDKKYGKSTIYNYLNNIRSISNGDLIITGSVITDFPHNSGWIMKVTNNGDSLWYRLYDNLYGDKSENNLYDVIPTIDNGFLSCGYVFPMQPDTGTQDAWVIKLDSIGCDTPGCDTTVSIPEIAYKNTEDELYIYPNPASNVLNMQYPIMNYECRSILEIFDIFGRKVKEIKIPKGQQQLNVNVSKWRNGLYIAVLKDDKKFIAKRKFVVLR